MRDLRLIREKISSRSEPWHLSRGRTDLVTLSRRARRNMHDRHDRQCRLPTRPPGDHHHQEDIVNGLRDKVALVTGGSSGIGQAIAIRLGEEGANVAINYVGRPDGAIATSEAIEHGVEICMKKVAEAGGRPILVAADVSDEQAVERMFDRVRFCMPPLDTE